ncbi:MAG: hypothetical protein OXS30_08040 [Chloroflexota bacterium]|nr:hypothetical protein [Chloroflexota bacterium]
MSERRRLFRDEAFARRGRTEPIDGLLRTTAPREWLFLALLGAALVGVLLWAVFGTIERGLSASCELVRSEAGQTEVVAELSAQDAHRLSQGQRARVTGSVSSQSWDGFVDQVTRAEQSTALNGADAPWQVRFYSPEALPFAPGGACRVRIVLSREAPIRLIATVGLDRWE